jgi:dUTP pyrophosphatase
MTFSIRQSLQFPSFMGPARREWKVGVQLLVDRAGSPVQATPGSSGFDLSSAEENDVVIEPGCSRLVCTGIALDLPPGLEGQVRSRSGLAAKSDYRGEIKIILANLGKTPFVVCPGDRIAQLVFNEIPRISLSAVDTLTVTERGSAGFGSSGKVPLKKSADLEGVRTGSSRSHAKRSKK